MHFLRNTQCCFPAMHSPGVWLILAWIFFLYHDNVHIESQQKALSFKWSLVNNLNTYDSTNAFNTVLNIQQRNNHLIQQNKHYRFLKMPQVTAEALAVQLSSGLKLWRVVSRPPSLCSVLCDLTAAVEFSLKEVNTAEGWQGRSAQERQLQLGRHTIFNPFLIKNYSGPTITECLWLMMQ